MAFVPDTWVTKPKKFCIFIIHIIFISQICLCSAQKSIQDNNGSPDVQNQKLHPQNELQVQSNRISPRHKRSNNYEVYGKSESEKPLYIELYAAVDVELYNRFEKNETKVIEEVRNVIRNVNALYLPLYIHVILVGVDVWKVDNHFELSTNPDDILAEATSYRMNILKKTNHDTTVIFTNTDLDGETVGKALIGTMCEKNLSVSVVQMTGNDVASITAHEIGHILGMQHDEDGAGCTCSSGICIMAERTQNSRDHLEQWSTCSISYLKDFLKTGLFSCLDNKPKNPIKPALCGDGILQYPEKCDCGPPSFCKSTCCDARTCKLTQNATCATGLCCDTDTCNFKSLHALCRKASSECDLPEFCSGETEFCPLDVYKWNGANCTDFNGHCWDGKCRSKERSCKNKFGKHGRKADDLCYKTMGFLNKCNKNYINGEASSCSRECGKLLCDTDGNDLSIHVQRGYITSTIGDTTCYHIKRDGQPDLVDDGSPCQNNMLCSGQKCIRSPSLSSTDCSSRCDNHGVCNSKGHCHCDPGYGPPDCRGPGVGGSFDSNGGGQFSDTFKTVMLLIFLVGVPLLILTWCLIVNSPIWWGRKGMYWTKTWSPCCARCLDNCCCPIMTEIAKKVDIPYTKPGQKIIIEKVSKKSTNKSGALMRSSEPSGKQFWDNRKSLFISPSPVPNVRFAPINQPDSSINAEIQALNNSRKTNGKFVLSKSDTIEKKSKKTGFSYDTPIPNVKFFPISQGNSSQTSLESTNSDISKNSAFSNNDSSEIKRNKNEESSNLKPSAISNTFKNVLSRDLSNNKPSRNASIQPVRVAPTIPPKKIKESISIKKSPTLRQETLSSIINNKSSTSVAANKSVKDLAQVFQKE